MGDPLQPEWQSQIWVADSDGKNPFQLTNFGGPLTGTPRWSPDGLWVAFDSRPEGQPDIFVIASEGDERRLTYRCPRTSCELVA